MAKISNLQLSYNKHCFISFRKTYYRRVNIFVLEILKSINFELMAKINNYIYYTINIALSIFGKTYHRV